MDAWGLVWLKSFSLAQAVGSPRENLCMREWDLEWVLRSPFDSKLEICPCSLRSKSADSELETQASFVRESLRSWKYGRGLRLHAFLWKARSQQPNGRTSIPMTKYLSRKWESVDQAITQELCSSCQNHSLILNEKKRSLYGMMKSQAGNSILWYLDDKCRG